MSNESLTCENQDVDQKYELTQTKESRPIKKVEYISNLLSSRDDNKFEYDFKRRDKKLSICTDDDIDNIVLDRLTMKSPLNRNRNGLSAIKINIDDVETPGHQSRLLADAYIGNRLGLMRESINPVSAETGANDIFYSNQRLNSRTDELEFKRNTFWKSCCDSVIDRRATVFFTQVAIGAIVIFFAMAKMWLSSPYRCSGDDPSVYIGLISVILGWFVPAPSMK